jgi:branched-chain amino acid aminotransferase
MMSRAVVIDGVCVSPERATISVYDRGFLYGDGVFETIRTYEGKLFALDEHLDRLAHSAERVGIALPVSKEALAREIADGLDAARMGASSNESYIRVMLTRGAGPLGLDPALALRPLRVILVEPLIPLPSELYRDGVTVVVRQIARAGDAAEGAKVSNYLESLLALRDAKTQGAHEALIVSADGSIREGTTSNVFAVCGGELRTPGEDAGILVGITRAHVLLLAKKAGLSVREGRLTVDELLHADEAFLTSSLREILPIVRVGAHPIGSASPGRVTRELHRSYRVMAGVGGGPMPWQPCS